MKTNTFLNQVTEAVLEQFGNFPDTLLLLVPNHRTGLYLKNLFKNQSRYSPYLIPEIQTLPEWLCNISGLDLIPEHIQILELYQVYTHLKKQSAEPFESFTKWGQIAIQDFNMLDYALADPKALYTQLQDIKTIEHWSLNQSPLSPRQEQYIQFMNEFYSLYLAYTQSLKNKKIGYLGFIAREASTKALSITTPIGVIAGQMFSKAELKTLQSAKTQQNLKWFWDLDGYYMNSNIHESGRIFRSLFKRYPNWKPKEWSYNLTENNKEITTVAVPGTLGQALHAAEIIQKWTRSGIAAESIAIILPHESMVLPLLRSLSGQAVNLSLGFPLRLTFAYACIQQLFQMQWSMGKSQQGIRMDALISLIHNPLFKSYLNRIGQPAETLLKSIKKQGSFVLTKEWICSQFKNTETQNLLLPGGLPLDYLKILKNWMQYCSNAQQDLESHALEELKIQLELLERTLSEYQSEMPWNSFKLYTDRFLQHLKIPLQGEPVRGIQILGLLESRCLDFSHFIVLNTNEGIVPAASHVGYFPYDLKYAFELPLPQDHESVYAYYIYRLLHRCQKAVFMYDTEQDVLGKGEKSRCLTQMESEFSNHPKIQWNSYSLNQLPSLNGFSANTFTRPQSSLSLERVNSLFALRSEKNQTKRGFSSTALNVSKSCSLRFYYQYILELKPPDELDDHINAGEFGTLIHNALEILYRPLINKLLVPSDLQNLQDSVLQICEQVLQNTIQKKPTGKNKLMLDVASMYVKEVLRWDEATARASEKKKEPFLFIALEHTLNYTIPANAETPALNFMGRIDRIDQIGHRYRIIDYKSSVNESIKLSSVEALFESTKHSKTVQLLWYSWIVSRTMHWNSDSIFPALLNIKKMSLHGIQFGNEKEWCPTAAVIDAFEQELINYSKRILSPDFKYVATDDASQCTYCPYSPMCHR